jgi:hypothetical protein
VSTSIINAQSRPLTFADRAACVTKYGIPAIPVKPRSKEPVLNNWQNLATTDPVRIAEWDKKNSQYNCGAVGRAGGFWIFEVDDPTLSTRIEIETGHSLDELDTLVVKSSGEKRHHYFKHDSRSEAMGNFSADDKDGEIFSVRGHNAYVVAPGSIHPKTGQPYEIVTEPVWGEIPTAPNWLMDWLLRAKSASAPKTTQIPETIPTHSRNQTLTSLAGVMRRKGASKSAILAALRATNHQCQPPLRDVEVITIAKSVAKYSPAECESPYSSKTGDSTRIGAREKFAALELEFRLPAVTINSTHREYVISPARGQKDGWFPLGAVSLVGGPSGGSKTTWMLQLLLAQKNRVPFLGHDTYGRLFLMLGGDRGEDAHKRTMERMNLNPVSVPFKPLPLAWDLGAAQAIVNQIEATDPLPEILFVEGVDMLVTEVNSIKAVARFVHELQKIAQHYRIALIGSLGSPKVKEGHGYTATRDNLLGSGGWGRTAESVALLSFPKNDDTNGRRNLTVVLRNAPAEKFALKFVDGLLEIDPDTHDGDNDEAEKASRDIDWYQGQARLAKDDPAKRWWTILDMERALHISHATADRHVRHGKTKGHLVQKPGGKHGRGSAAQFRWNDSKSNPLWVAQQAADAVEVF